MQSGICVRKKHFHQQHCIQIQISYTSERFISADWLSAPPIGLYLILVTTEGAIQLKLCSP